MRNAKVTETTTESRGDLMTKLQRKTHKNGAYYPIIFMLLAFSVGQFWAAEKNTPVVRAILFTSPTCPHCAMVKEEVLPPLAERYGPQLQVVVVSIATTSGYELFLSACMKHALLRLSVPLLIVGNTPMVGSDEIPQKFPGLIEKYIAEGGIGWPNISGLNAMLAESPAFSPEAAPRGEQATAVSAPATQGHIALDFEPPADTSVAKAAAHAEKTSTAEASQSSHAANPKEAERAASAPPPIKPAESDISRIDETASAGSAIPAPEVKEGPSGIIDLTADTAEAGVWDRIKRDKYGNGLAILVLAGMILTLLASMKVLRKSSFQPAETKNPRFDWLIPLLTIAGMGVAAYLSHVELRQVEAVCGPVGDCNTVNQSEYAKLFGVLPIGVLGLFGFLVILAVWALRRWGPERLSRWAAAGILAMTGFGVLFSVYLTFLEPFVIGATCLWCLSSAAIMTALYALSLKPGRQAFSALFRTRRPSG